MARAFNSGDVGSLTLKKLCTTRWTSRIDSVRALRDRYLHILKVLTRISLTSENQKERSESILSAEENGIVRVHCVYRFLGKNFAFLQYSIQGTSITKTGLVSYVETVKLCAKRTSTSS